jgi:hypothetical protein
VTHFPDLLSTLQQKLILPQPARSRILLEIADDLEGLYQHYRGTGLDDATARKRAVDEMDLTTGVLTDLIAVHTSPYRRFLDGLSDRARSRWERGLLFVLSVFVCFMVVATVRAGSVFAQANVFVWPSLLCFAIGFILGLERAYVLFLRKAYAAREAQRGLGALLGLSIAQFIIGIAGAWLGLFLASRAVVADPTRIGEIILDWMFGGTALLIVSLGGCVITALWWLVLAARAAAVEEEEAYTLLQISGAREEKAQ